MNVIMSSGKGKCRVNGRTFSGKNISIVGDKVYIDGKLAEESAEKDFNIQIEGDVEKIELESGKISVSGSAGEVISQNGDISCGDVGGSVSSQNGDVRCGVVSGNVRTQNGDISHK